MSKNQESFWRSIWKHGLNSPYLQRFLGNGTMVGNWAKGVTGSGLTQAQTEQNEFNSQEAATQRAWQEQMDNTKYQRQTADMQAAGLNPAMMYGGSTSASTPSGASASGGDVGSPSAGLLDSIMNIVFAKQRLANLKAEEGVLKSQEFKNNKEGELAGANVSLTDVNTEIQRIIKDYTPQLKQNEVALLSAEIADKWKSVEERGANVAELGAKAALEDVQRQFELIKKEWYPRLSAAKEKSDLGTAASAFARAALDQYSKHFAETHGGQMPGYSQWLGLASAIEGVLKDFGWSESEMPDAPDVTLNGSGDSESLASWMARHIAKIIDKGFEFVANAPQ